MVIRTRAQWGSHNNFDSQEAVTTEADLISRQ